MLLTDPKLERYIKTITFDKLVNTFDMSPGSLVRPFVVQMPQTRYQHGPQRGIPSLDQSPTTKSNVKKNMLSHTVACKNPSPWIPLPRDYAPRSMRQNIWDKTHAWVSSKHSFLVDDMSKEIGPNSWKAFYKTYLLVNYYMSGLCQEYIRFSDKGEKQLQQQN